jgi:hypothetical protein
VGSRDVARAIAAVVSQGSAGVAPCGFGPCSGARHYGIHPAYAGPKEVRCCLLDVFCFFGEKEYEETCSGKLT